MYYFLILIMYLKKKQNRDPDKNRKSVFRVPTMIYVASEV